MRACRYVTAFSVIMPIYEYQCPKCQRKFEEWVRLSDAHGQEPCPECGTPSPRIISHTSFVLKGGGWYVSDYGYRKGIKEDGTSQGAAPAAAKSSEANASEPAAPAAAAKADTSKATPSPSAKPAPTAKAVGD